jgi:uncharacterized protein YggE
MFENFKTKNFVVLVSCLVLILIIYGIVGIINEIKEGCYIGADVAYKNTINVSGEGRVYTKPDIAVVSLSVITEGWSVGNVQEGNSEKMNGLIDFLKDFGIVEKDIKTKNYQIQPRYSYEEGRAPWISGYRISQTLEIKIREMDKIGEILEGSVNAGANQVSSLVFEVDNDEEFKAQARKLAIEDAKEKAKKLASDLGVKLIKIGGFTEDSDLDYIYRATELAIGGGGGAPQIELGENEIAVNVTLIYEID